MCSACKGEGEEEIKGLVPIILQARPVRWVSLRLYTAYSAVIPMLARIAVRAPLNPVLVGCHRFKRIQVDTVCRPKILISEYALS